MVLLWEVTECLFTGDLKKNFLKTPLPSLWCSFIMRMFPPLKKTLRTGSSLKYTVLRNHQNNCFLHFLQKSNICKLLFPLNAVSKRNQFRSLQANSGHLNAPWNSTSAEQALTAFQGGWWSMRDSPEMLSICQNDLISNYGKQNHSDMFYSTLWVKRGKKTIS